MDISQNTRNQITNVLLPHFEDQATRETLIRRAFSDIVITSQFDFTGNAANFTDKTIRTLLIVGDSEPDKPAIVALLEQVKGRVGVTKREQIDALMVTIRAELAEASTSNSSPAAPPASSGGGSSGITIHGNVEGDNVNIGGTQNIQGDFTFGRDRRRDTDDD